MAAVAIGLRTASGDVVIAIPASVQTSTSIVS